MFTRTSWLFRIALLLPVALLGACGSTDEQPPSHVSDGTQTVATKPKPTAEFSQFQAALSPVIDKSQSMTREEFLAAHAQADAAVPLKLTYDPLQAKYFDVVDGALKLTAAEKAKVAENGFVVSERLNYPTMAQALVDVYAKDMPVLITTDMVLQALHASYDDILQTLEKTVLIGLMTDVLAQSHVALAKVDPGADPLAAAAKVDADFYLTLARTLLAGQSVPSLTGAAVDAKVAEFLGFVAGLQMTDVELFGTVRTMDFSQFKPRGHYEGDPLLERYFRMMMLLGRADLRFVEFDAQSNQWLYRPRQVMAAMLLKQAMDAGSQAMAKWTQANDVITLMVGPVDYIDFAGVDRLVADQKWQKASDIATLDKAALEDMIARLIAGTYGSQKIASHYLETNPLSSEPTPLPPSFAFLGQRFVVDSHVFSNVVYDRVIHDGAKVQRVLPAPLDAWFVLGNDQVLPLLAPEFDKHPYWGALHTLRWLVDSYEPSFWQDNLYNLWLHSLRALNAPTTAAKFPQPMRTPAWRDKTARTQLASWAQLRHDTILYAKQSYTGGVSCEHPDGWVEPYPEFFARLETFADVGGQALVNLPFTGEQAWLKTSLQNYFANFKLRMGQLRVLAERELAGDSFSADEVGFLTTVIVAQMGCGAPVYSGWYPTLFFNPERVAEFKPTIADVHTNPNAGPLPGPDVLHVATSSVDLMVLAADTCDGAETFVGPVFRYHEVDVKEIKRLSDKDWEAMLKDGTAPAQPKWTESFVVPK
jgi:hypothetical protein